MSDVLVVQASNEETLLPRLLRVLAQQGLKVKDLRMTISKDEQELELNIVLSTLCAEQAVRLLAKQVAVKNVVRTNRYWQDAI
ncbi:MAG TPA: hypothetical protein IAB06_08080 [Candidatus Avacidaminococcus intestinavium]|uniref:ACT domain-containing protein n=1 Tax=Candidatus Avacidaminococcus intestinavium TaxID=2840684 RepID=A0A9D1SMF8_9FIRM|nr:hypothetical protein [Candidatus Avacidaminococcus intestinavium]